MEIKGAFIVKCSCGEIIPTEDIDFNNGTNEEGEEYGEVSAQCHSCKKNFEGSQWGEWNNESDAIDYLNEVIENYNKYSLNIN